MSITNSQRGKASIFNWFDPGNGSTSGYLTNPLAVDLDVGNNSLTDVHRLSFENNSYITSFTNSGKDELYYGDQQISSYKPRSDNSLALTTVIYANGTVNPTTSAVSGLQLPLNNPKSFFISRGDANWHMFFGILLDSVAVDAPKYPKEGIEVKVFASSVDLTAANNAYTSGDKTSISLPDDAVHVITIDSTAFKGAVVSKSGYSLVINCIATPDSDSSVPGIVNFGFNYDRVGDKQYIYIIMVDNHSGQTLDISTFNFTAEKSQTANSFVIQNNTSSDNALLHQDGGNLLVNNEIVLTQNYASITTSDDGNSQEISRINIPDDTSGLLQAYAFNDHCAFIINSHIKNAAGSLTINGSVSHKIGDSDNDFSLSTSDSTVFLNVNSADDTANWKCRFQFDKNDLV